jgi:adenylosuccinate synthase
MDKVQRTGIRMEDFIADDFNARYLEHAEHYKKITECVYNLEFIDIQDSLERLEKIRHQLKPFIKDSVAIISDAISSDKSILYEGAQGAFLDVDHGTYPFVTSSNTTIGGAYSGGGVYLEFEKRIGIVKAYTTRVGAGPFPTELKDEVGEKLREKGREFGATTGRPRRCGWLDLHLLKRSFITNGFNYIVLTKLDCLNGFETLKVSVDYDDQNKPVYEDLPGWEEDIVGTTDYDNLPANCQNYIQFIEDYMNMKIGLISTGPDRKDVIFQEKL